MHLNLNRILTFEDLHFFMLTQCLVKLFDILGNNTEQFCTVFWQFCKLKQEQSMSCKFQTNLHIHLHVLLQVSKDSLVEDDSDLF